MCFGGLGGPFQAGSQRCSPPTISGNSRSRYKKIEKKLKKITFLKRKKNRKKKFFFRRGGLSTTSADCYKLEIGIFQQFPQAALH